ncbi:MAG: PDZ domain-containing protein, partial [Planctomycetota bacterium]
MYADEKEKDKDKDDDYYQMMKLFADTYEQIERNYVKDIDRRVLLEAAIRGMVQELDQYSNYISPDDLSRFNQVVEQEFGGIGIQVHIDENNGRLTVMTPLPGTPAYKAGIQAGDIIDQIEGKTTKGFTLPQAIQILK